MWHIKEVFVGSLIKKYSKKVVRKEECQRNRWRKQEAANQIKNDTLY